MSLIKLKNNALDNLTSFEGSASLGDMVFISSATASSSASIEFTLGDYKEYKFFFVNIHPSATTGNPLFQFQCSTDGGSNYNTTITSTHFRAGHNENDADQYFSYNTGKDQAQGTSFQSLTDGDVGGDNDQCQSGMLQLFNPSNDIYVKHYIGHNNSVHANDVCGTVFSAGYFNSVSPLTNIKFQFSSGNIDDGKILMFGFN